MFQLHSYSKRVGQHSSRYESKIPQRGYSDIIVQWITFFEGILLNLYTPEVQIGSACHQKQRQGDEIDYQSCISYNHISSCQIHDLGNLDSVFLYGLTWAPVERAAVKSKAKRQEVGTWVCHLCALVISTPRLSLGAALYGIASVFEHFPIPES